MIKIITPYLEANDPETRSTLSYKEKEKLVIEAIAKLYKPSKDPNIQLKRTKKNGLAVCSRNEVLQALDWLAKNKHIIKTCPEDYPYKTISSSGFGDSYNEPVEIDPKKPFSIEVLSHFISWHETYKAIKNLKLSDIYPDQIEAIKKVYFEIKKEYKINPGRRIILTENEPITGTLKHKALEYLKDREIIYYTLTNSYDGKQIIDISFYILEAKTFEEENKEFLKNVKGSKENYFSPKKRLDKKDNSTTEPVEENIFKQNNDYWTFYFTGMKAPIERVKHLKGFLYIRYLLLHPNKKFEAFELDNAVEGFADPSASEIKFQNEQTASDSFGTVINSNLGTFSTKKLKMGLTDYEDELNSGELTFEEKEDVAEKIRNITNELERRSDPDKENRQSKIRMAIKRAMRVIAKASEQDTSLFLHLQNHIRISWPISYTPANPIKWEA